MTDREDDTVYEVVVNHEEQYSIWPADREVPHGWRAIGTRGHQVRVPRPHRGGLDRHAAAQRSNAGRRSDLTNGTRVPRVAALPRPERLTTVAEHWPMPGATVLGEVHPADRFEVGVVLRRRPDGPALPDIDKLGRQPVRQRHHLTSEEFEARFGASPADAAAVTEFGRDHGLETVGVDLARRTVTLAGIAARCSRAFGVNLRRYAFGEDVFRGHDGPITLPTPIADLVVGVLGLDERPMATRVPTPHPGTFDVAQVEDVRQRAGSRPAGSERSWRRSSTGRTPSSANTPRSPRSASRSGGRCGLPCDATPFGSCARR